MLDYLFRFDAEADAQAALPDYWSEEGWRGDTAFPGVRVFVQTGEESRTYFPGWFIWVSDREYRPDLVGEGGACRIVGDREAGQVIYTAPDLAPNAIAAAHIEPVPAGSQYHFGVQPVPE